MPGRVWSVRPQKRRRIATDRSTLGVALALAALLAAVVASVGGVSPARAATQYYSGTLTANTWLEEAGWNYYTYNEAVNCVCGGSGPTVGIKQIHTNGQELWYYTAPGNIDICHGADYTRTMCANLTSNSISLTCYRQTSPC